MSNHPFFRTCMGAVFFALCPVPLTWPQPTRPSAPKTAVSRQQPSAPGVESFSPTLLEQLNTIKAAALSDPYTYRQLAYLTENIGPRPSGSANAKIAVKYIAEQMRELGLDVHLEPVEVPHWVRGTENGELVGYSTSPQAEPRKIVLTALGGSTSTGARGITADLLVVDDFSQLKRLGQENVNGKIVLFNRKFDRQKSAAGLAFNAYREVVEYRENGPKAAAALGAVAALVRSVGSADYRLPHTGDSEPAAIPAAAVCDEDASLMTHLAQQAPLRLHLTLTPQKLPDEKSFNVIGDLKGSEHPEEVVVVSAHLDSWDLGTGAIDDAAGIAMTLETAHVLQQLHFHPKRTLRVIAWMDEENNDSGSNQYLRDYSSEFPHHIAAIESDAGAAHPLGFAMSMSQAGVDSLKPLVTILGSIGTTVFEQTTRAPGTTDIAPLAERGIPVIGILQDQRHYYDYHHSAADTLDKVVPSELNENAAAMAVIAFALTEMRNPPLH